MTPLRGPTINEIVAIAAPEWGLCPEDIYSSRRGRSLAQAGKASAAGVLLVGRQ